jgi:hypothetical protein
MDGKVPKARLVVEARRPMPGLVEIGLVNAGTADAGTDVRVSVRWRGACLVASDGLCGFSNITGQASELRLRGSKTDLLPPLGPGEERIIGWVRLDKDCEVQTDVLQ